MNRLQAKGNWNVAKGKLRKLYGQALEDGERFDEGQKDELVGRAQKRAGKAQENFPKLLKKWHHHPAR